MKQELANEDTDFSKAKQIVCILDKDTKVLDLFKDETVNFELNDITIWI